MAVAQHDLVTTGKRLPERAPMTISFPLPLDFFRGARNLTQGLLAEALNAALIGELQAGVTEVRKKSDFGVFSGGKATLIPLHRYNIMAPIDLGTDVLEGLNATIEGDLTPATALFTNSTSPLFTALGPGFVQMLNLIAVNGAGPFISAALGGVPNVSVFFFDKVRFSGDPLGNGTGVGTIGTISGADIVTISNCFFLGVIDGFKIDGTIKEITMRDTGINARSGATAFKGIEILAAADLDITVFDTVRFGTVNAADRCVKFATGATYGSPIRLRGCTTRGPGTFVDSAGLQKTDPSLIANDNEGDTAPIDSQFTGNATFVGNTVETVIGGGNQGVMLPVGNGAASHEIFDGDAFVERFTLLGAETQLQSFRYDGLRSRTFKVELHCQLNRAGGGTVFIGLGLAHDPISGGGPVLITRSVNATEVGNSASPGYTTMVLDLDPGDKVLLRVSNNTNTNNIIMNSGNWAISLA